jgi:membrane-associated phospholipid phosphatase
VRPIGNETSDATRVAAIGFVVAVIVALASGIVASDGRVPSTEQAVFHWINDLPSWMRPLMWVFQLAGLLLAPVVAALVAAAFRRWWLVLSLLALVPLKLIVEKAVVKQLVERERPATTICGHPDAFDPTCGNFRGVPQEGLSFVSGHAVVAWSVAAVLWPELPARWRWLPVVVATLNAVARVYLGAHNPLDVVGGAAIGVAIGSLVVLAVGVVRSAVEDTDRVSPRTG